jgi:hypothetical protein
MGKRVASLTPISFPNLLFSLVFNLSEIMAVFFKCHGSWTVLADSPPLGGIFEDQASQHPVGVYPPWVLEEVPQR